MSGVEVKRVAAGEDGMRLDRWFGVHYPSVPHGRLQKLLRTGQVRLDSNDLSVPLESERRVVRLDSDPQIPGQGNGTAGAGAEEQGEERA